MDIILSKVFTPDCRFYVRRIKAAACLDLQVYPTAFQGVHPFLNDSQDGKSSPFQLWVGRKSWH